MAKPPSRETFTSKNLPRLSARGPNFALGPHIGDVIALHLEHYSCGQIAGWLTETMGRKVHRSTVIRIVKRIKDALANLDGTPSSASEAVLAGVIRKVLGVADSGVPVFVVEAPKCRTAVKAPQPSSTTARSEAVDALPAPATTENAKQKIKPDSARSGDSETASTEERPGRIRLTPLAARQAAANDQRDNPIAKLMARKAKREGGDSQQ